MYRAVPYEARSSLKINRLHSSQSERQSLSDKKLNPLPTSTSSPLVADRIPTPSSVPSCTSVCTQTTDTAFALCVRCSSTHTTLMSAAAMIQGVCCSLHLPSLSSDTDWKREAELGVLNHRQWAEAMDTDLKRIEAHSLEQEEELVRLRDQLTQQKSHEEILRSDLSQLSLKHHQLEVAMSDNKKTHTAELAMYREAATAQLGEMERARKSVQEQRDQLAAKLSCVQKQKDELMTSSADIGEI